MQQLARTANLDIAYLESGPADGPAVILLHGWPSDVHDWDEVGPPLEVTVERRVVDALLLDVAVEILDVGLVEVDLLDGGCDVPESEHAELLTTVDEGLYFF